MRITWAVTGVRRGGCQTSAMLDRRQVADRDVGDLGRPRYAAGPDRRRRSASQAPNAIRDGFDLDLSAPKRDEAGASSHVLVHKRDRVRRPQRLTTENGTPSRSPFPGSSTRSDDAGRGRVAHALRGSGKAGRAAYAARPALPRPCRSRLHAGAVPPRRRALGTSTRARVVWPSDDSKATDISIYWHRTLVMSTDTRVNPRDSHP